MSDITLDSKIPTGPDRGQVGEPQVRHEARQPEQQAQVRRHRRRHRPGRRRRPPPRSAQLGYNVKVFTFHDSPRRAHSIAAQGGINAAKNYKNDGDCVYRLFYDTVKGGDFRAREANVYRLAEVSVEHHRPVRRPGRALRPRVRRPARQPLLRRRAGVAAPSTPGARPASSCCSAPTRRSCSQVAPGHRRSCYTDRDARRRRQGRRAPAASSPATCSPARSRSHSAHAVLLATGGYGNVFFLSTNANELQRHRRVAGPPQGRPVRQPLLHADPPDLHPGQRRVPVEAHAHVRVAAQRRPHLGAEELRRRPARPTRSPRPSATTSSSASTRRSATSCPATSPPATPRPSSTRASGVGPLKNGVYLDFADAIDRLGERRRPGALRQPLRHVRAHHRREPVQDADAHLPRHPLHDGRAVGGLQPHDHRARACSPSARPTSPTTAPTASAPRRSCRAWPTATSCSRTRSATTWPACSASRAVGHRRPGVHRRPRPSVQRPTSTSWLSVEGTNSVDHYHRELGKIVWDYCGMARDKAGPREGPRRRSPRCATSSEERPGPRHGRRAQPVAREGRRGSTTSSSWPSSWCRDALHREESCGGHFREEHQTEEGEAQRDDENFAYVGAWEWQRRGHRPRTLHKEPLEFEYVHLDPEELQVDRARHEPHAQGLAPGRPRRRRSLRDLRGRPASTRTCRSSRCSTSSTSASSTRARSRSRSTATAARASAAPAAS